jgi:hypothetical protein
LSLFPHVHSPYLLRYAPLSLNWQWYYVTSVPAVRFYKRPRVQPPCDMPIDCVV